MLFYLVISHPIILLTIYHISYFYTRPYLILSYWGFLSYCTVIAFHISLYHVIPCHNIVIPFISHHNILTYIVISYYNTLNFMSNCYVYIVHCDILLFVKHYGITLSYFISYFFHHPSLSSSLWTKVFLKSVYFSF